MKKIVLSLLLSLALIPTIPFYMANAENLIDFDEVTIAPGKSKNLANCIVKAKSFTLSGTPVPSGNADFYHFVAKTEDGNENGGGTAKDGAYVFSQSLDGIKKAVSFSIQSDSTLKDLAVNSTLAFDLDKDGCYDCTLSDGSKESVGDCSIDNDNDADTPVNGTFHLLAKFTTTILGILLFLF